MTSLNPETTRLFQAVLSLPETWNVVDFASTLGELIGKGGVDFDAGFQRDAIRLGPKAPRDIPEGATPWQVLIEHVLPQAPSDSLKERLEFLGDVMLSKRDETYYEALQRRPEPADTACTSEPSPRHRRPSKTHVEVEASGSGRGRGR